MMKMPRLACCQIEQYCLTLLELSRSSSVVPRLAGFQKLKHRCHSACSKTRDHNSIILSAGIRALHARIRFGVSHSLLSVVLNSHNPITTTKSYPTKEDRQFKLTISKQKPLISDFKFYTRKIDIS